MLIRKDENRSGCSGCFGIVLLIILLFSGCSAIFGNSDEDDTEDTSPKTEDNSKKESETSDKEETTSSKEENTENDNSKTDLTDGEINTTPEDDTVYGKLSQPHGNNKIVNVDDTLYILNDNDEILQAEKSFSKLPLDKNLDKNLLNEHIKDYMAKDAEFVSNLTDTKQKYHSKSLNKDYYVQLVLDEHGNVNRLIISSIH
ncbi:hypothetical protein IS850_000652 [Staphylococcus pseudintermedius]|nr:hypothetical protein [Staphylococcus pseudintermedius]HAR6034343.1 hypothetical protein [Staphylococcus pseudintermedius]HAR6430648.1 hypothetical protein [Staphylococcus pseudintermedius]